MQLIPYNIHLNRDRIVGSTDNYQYAMWSLLTDWVSTHDDARQSLLATFSNYPAGQARASVEDWSDLVYMEWNTTGLFSPIGVLLNEVPISLGQGSIAEDTNNSANFIHSHQLRSSRTITFSFKWIPSSSEDPALYVHLCGLLKLFCLSHAT